MKIMLALAAVVNIMAFPPRWTPPAEYRHDTVAVVTFIDSQDKMNSMCSNTAGKLPANQLYVGCASWGPRGRYMYVANPCGYPDEKYARSLCHEMGHVNGWPGDHPNPQ